MAHKAIIAIASAAALAGAVVLRRFGVEPVPTVFYLLAWYPTLLLLDALVALRGGPSLWDAPREGAAMLGWSVVIWCAFEALNFRLQDWYYVFVPASRWQRWLGVSASFATVVPAILLPERMLDRLGVGKRLKSRPVPLSPRDLRLAGVLGGVVLLATLAAPAVLHPLTWGALWLVAEPALVRVDPERSLFADIGRGQWGRIVRLMIGGLVAGVLWETYNAGSRAQWIYTVPFLEDFKIFEMPPLGFLGFAFFALEAWSLYHLCRALATPRRAVIALGFVAAVLAGIDRWTVSSTRPSLDQVSGLSAGTRTRLAAAGLADVFPAAVLPADTLAARTGLPTAEARRVGETLRLVALRGIGTRHAAQLAAVGVTSVADLARADPAPLWRALPHDPHPTPAEVRVWVRAARRPQAR
jgi:Domain of unknown function (DUF4332)